MKYFTSLLALTLALTLAACHPKSTTKPSTDGSTSHGNGGGVVTPPADTALLPTGGIKPLQEPNQAQVQSTLVTTYLRGEIEQCKYNGQTVYRCSRNAPDAGSEVFDNAGTRIGRCYYSTGAIDPICKEATDCKVIYRMAGNIWGKPEVPWVKPR
jgi:hypothetical protein